MLRLALFGTVIALMSSATGQSLSLTYGTINGVFVCDQLFDDLLGLLGRPSAVVGQQQSGGQTEGPRLYYHSDGISVSFHPGELGQQRVLTVGIDLASRWDKVNDRWFLPFTGDMDPRATGQWRSYDTLGALSQLNPIELSPEDLRAEFVGMGIPLSVVPSDLPHQVRVNRGRFMLYFHHEPITRFLERIALNCIYE